MKNTSFIIIPFYSIYEKSSSIDDYYYSDLYSKFEIGSNNQQIEMKLQLNSFPLYLTEKKSVSKNFQPYISHDSNTYNRILKLLFYDKDFISGITSTDYFTLNPTKVKMNFKFILAEQMTFYPVIPPGSIGFRISPLSSYREKKINFIEQLKEKKIISDYSFSFHFNEKDENNGEIIIGVGLDEIKNEFKNKIIIKSGSSEKQLDWGFMFNNVELIKYNNSENNISCFCNDDAILDLSHNYIISTKAFSYFIKKIFFNKLIEEKKCQIEEIKNSNYYNYLYRIIKCDKNIYNHISNNFPIIKFTLKDINSLSLNFTYKDLFFNKDDHIYFNIILYHIENENDFNINLDLCKNSRWIFGKLFFKKYPLSMNKDKKIIIFYFRDKNEVKDIDIINKNENNSKVKLKIIIWILVILLFLLGFALFHFIKKNFWLKNKISNKNRKNILVNEMEYFPHSDE